MSVQPGRGFYDGWSGCRAGSLPGGTPARLTATDGSGWIRVGVAEARVTSVTAVLPDGKTVSGTVEAVHGVPCKRWAVSFDISDATQIVFRDAAGHQVTRLSTASGSYQEPPRPNSGGSTGSGTRRRTRRG